MYVKLFVGNLSWGVDDAMLEEVFRAHGEVQSARVITDRDTGRSRGLRLRDSPRASATPAGGR